MTKRTHGHDIHTTPAARGIAQVGCTCHIEWVKFTRLVVASVLVACSTTQAASDVAPGESSRPEASPDGGVAKAAPASPEKEPATIPPSTSPPTTAPANPPAAVGPEVVLSGHALAGFAVGETSLFTIESDTQTRLIATDKSAPHEVKTLLHEDILDGVRFEDVAFMRGRVYYVDSYGALRSAKEDGSDRRNEPVLGSSTRLLAASTTMWLADLPRFVGDSLTFHYTGTAQLSLNESRLDPKGAVGDLAVDDDALVYATRGSAPSLREWAPALTGTRRGDRPLIALPEEGRGVGLDATRAFVYLPVAKEVRAVDRSTGTVSTVLSGVAFDTPPMLRSDGTNLYLLTATALRRCAIANCASSMVVLASGLEGARRPTLDATHVWFAAGPKGGLAIVRVPR